ncbi:MAG: nucleic acid-binding protein [Microcoleus sp. PH2017_01_SCD_O_A]|uniref:nucleic acid-binding protein n=1 Tax=unclassified Microcoleus TaxID=2642155 RepID=UPI001D8A4110|nr:MULTISPECIES: nucleic acid-binding protein [unclassified Microcoleus]MCC3443107.1 nucleic acid-binding protein [Microcoleus sp. PH2017_03_ELD_O_A]TAE14044.1 MAG: nucleic acid-binding protein [Oscillatoriales cyanobacterium]MCC3423467.1 nucleic acid-binding protein [Microcoleus sp. PH2017_01_SCD_O_A]MCC3451927.1 nucleic acid-binding protein [Microcoleus sp. PH2017_08_TRC_O_A]MCC3490358.1 nucleic acid-binding protein [Microcoleus sp. PH2017_16_JOR_D_A]
MSKIVLLDSGPLGIVTNPKAASPLSQEGKLWLQSLPLKGYIVVLPEIADYEVRRELIRAGKVAGIRRLDELKSQIPYRPLTTEVMLLAAQLWADARKRGRPTAEPNALDGDVILAAQAILLANEANEVVIATTNVGHLSQFVDAREWRSIS